MASEVIRVGPGSQGVPGLDGASIVDCNLDRDGNLIVRLPAYDEDRTAIVSASGVITKQEWLDVINDINRLEAAVTGIREVTPVMVIT